MLVVSMVDTEDSAVLSELLPWSEIIPESCRCLALFVMKLLLNNNNLCDRKSVSAVIYRLIETAKENDLNPFPYMQYLFEKLPNVDIKNSETLANYLPWPKDLPQICRNLQQ